MWLGVREIATCRQYGSSYTFAQWFGDDVFKSLQDNSDRKLARLKRALSCRESALQFLGLMKENDELQDIRTTAEAFLAAGLSPDHPWLRRQLNQLLRSAWIKLALGGPFELQGNMGAWADLPDNRICTVDLPAGQIVLSRYPIRDPKSFIVVTNDPCVVENPLPGSIYLNDNLAKQLDGDFDGDSYITNTQESVLEAVRAKNWYPEYKREDVPPKRRLCDPLSNLPWVAVNSLGNRIGTITLGVAGAVHAEKHDLVAPLSAALQAEVQSLKWDTRSDKRLVEEAMMLIPEHLTLPKQDQTLFVDFAEAVKGDTPLLRHYNRIVKEWRKQKADAIPLAHFKSIIPLWSNPDALDFIEETIAVVQTYNRWIGSILTKIEEPTMDDLQGPLNFLRAWSDSKVENRKTWVVALWHTVHTNRSEVSTGSAAFHCFTDEILALISENSCTNVKVYDPRKKGDELLSRVTMLPLVGGLAAAGDNGRTFYQRIVELKDSVTVETRQNSGINPAFWVDNLYLGQIPKDHQFYGSIPVGQTIQGRLTIRSKTIYFFTSSTSEA